MSEYIERQATFDALEKVAGFFPYKIPGNADTYDKYNEAWNDAIGRAEMEIESIEPADVVLVVRCDNCKYYGSRRWCELHSSVFDDNAFCSYGERKE